MVSLLRPRAVRPSSAVGSRGWGKSLPTAAKLIPHRSRGGGQASRGLPAWSPEPGRPQGTHPATPGPSLPPLCTAFIFGTLEFEAAKWLKVTPVPPLSKLFRCVGSLLTQSLGSFPGDG